MLKKVSSYMDSHHMLDDCKNLILGVSGGADSICLFKMMQEITKEKQISLIVVHIEHGIRGKDSLSDAAFVENICKTHGVKYYCFSYPVPEIIKQTKESTEEAGRRLRYAAFEEVASQYEKSKVAIAHNKNDNAETLLFHMARGSSLKGMCGISPVRGNIIRPLLCLTREEIELWLKEKQQTFQTDWTNFTDEYTRNKIRLQVLPKLNEVNARAVEHMTEISETIRQTYAYILTQATEKKNDETYVLKKEDGYLLKNALFKETPMILYEEIVYQIVSSLTQTSKDISKDHVKSVCNLKDMQTSSQCSLPKNVIAIKTYEGICLQVKKTKENENQALKNISDLFQIKVINRKDVPAEIPKNKYTKWFDYDKIKNGLQIRTRQQGDYFVMDESGYTKSLKKYFIEAKIEKELRDEILLLADDGHIIWIVGYRISAAYKITDKTKRIIEVRFIGGKDNE